MKDPERAGFQLQLGHCQGTCSKGTADTEYMSIKAVGPIHLCSLASHVESAMYTQAKVYIRNSDAFASAGPGTPHGAQMIQPLLDIIRLHQPVGSCEHAVSPMRPEPLFNDMEDLAPKALAEWSFFGNFLGIYFGRRFAQRLGL